MSGAPARRQALRELMAAGLLQAHACRALAITRSSARYQPRLRDEIELIEAIKLIRARKRRWGYKRVHKCLRKDGYVVNRKKIERIWREQGFTQPLRRPKKKRRTGDTVPLAARHQNHVWTYDFIFDATAGGERISPDRTPTNSPPGRAFLLPLRSSFLKLDALPRPPLRPVALALHVHVEGGVHEPVEHSFGDHRVGEQLVPVFG